MPKPAPRGATTVLEPEAPASTKRAPRKAAAKKPAPRKAAPRAAVKSERQKATEAVVAKLNKEPRQGGFGAGSVVRADQIVVPPRLPTGALAFDVAMTDGFPVNQWTEVVGNENAGKTTVILKAIAKNQKIDPDYFVVWVASESFDPVLADMCGVDRTRIYLIEENVMEVAFQEVLEFVEGRGCDMVVIDSYPSMTTQQEDKKDMNENTMGGAKVLNLFMRKCTKASKRSMLDPANDRPFTGIIVNQWREKIGVFKGDNRTTPGGKGKNFWMYARLDVKRIEWLLDSKKQKVGQVIKIVCFKMKGARPQCTGQVDFYFADFHEFKAGDYDDFKQIVNLALAMNVIERRGSGYVGPGGEYIKSLQGLLDTLASDLDWQEQVSLQVLAAGKNGLAPVDVDEDEEDDAAPSATVLQLVPAEEEEAPRVVPKNRRKTV